MYKIADLVKLLNVSRMTICRKIADGKIKAIRVGGSWRIPKEEVSKILKYGV